MSEVIQKIKEKLESLGINASPDDDPNKLFVFFAFEDKNGEQHEFSMMFEHVEEPNIIFITSEIPVEFSQKQEEEILLATAYMNRAIKIGSAVYWPNINRIVFRFYTDVDEESMNMDMVLYCYYEAIDLVRRFFSYVDLFEKGALNPKDIVEMEKSENADFRL